MKYEAPKAEMFAVVTFVEKNTEHIWAASHSSYGWIKVLVKDVLNGSKQHRKMYRVYI